MFTAVFSAVNLHPMRLFLRILTISLLLILLYSPAGAQCSVCTKTAQQLGDKPAMGLNQGILYLMWMPFAIVGFIAYRWWRSQKKTW